MALPRAAGVQRAAEEGGHATLGVTVDSLKEDISKVTRLPTVRVVYLCRLRGSKVSVE